MTITTLAAHPATALRAFRDALVAAPQYVDPRLSTAANGEERAKIIRGAYSALAAAVPELPQRTVTRADVLAARAPKTADEVAIQAREREKVDALLAAGRPFADIVSEASDVRIAALIDSLETTAATEPGEAAEREELLVDRLVALGAADAVTAATEDRDNAATTAWNAVLSEALVSGEVSVANRTAVFHADEEGYAQAFSASDVPVDWSAVRRIEATYPFEATA